ncbi:MAG: polysaccharide biosynthesis/export family protein [Hydrogenophilaceae bacterium]|nr:polysaccharide biosynthesis/export family protein [Hydrogenophilaceae bacterium]
MLWLSGSAMAAPATDAPVADGPAAVVEKPVVAAEKPPEPQTEPQTEPPSPNAYRLHEGDALEVSVWREDNLHKELRILPDGSITFPLAGRVEVAGLTTTEAEAKISARIEQYLTDPVVTVVITGINGSRVYVLGNVVKPGPVILDVPMTLLQALSLAGGLGKFADNDAIKILRSTQGGREILKVRYSDLIKAKDLSTDYPLQAGDTILVP